MAQFNGPLDILKLLDSSNCGKCRKPTCLAFAGAVFRGQSKLDDCPKLENEVIERYSDYTSSYISADQLGDNAIEGMKKRITQIDLASVAQKLGADYADGKLTLKCLGKDVSVAQDGSITTEIHVNLWMAGPIFTYILDGRGSEISGKWVTFRELDGGEYKYPLFEQRCEKPLKRVADIYPGLFEDMLQIFNGKKVDYHYFADISIMLHPLPKVPVMICYSKPVDELESALSIFFDSTAADNLGLEGAFTLGVGLTMMFEKIALRHSSR